LTTDVSMAGYRPASDSPACRDRMATVGRTRVVVGRERRLLLTVTAIACYRDGNAALTYPAVAGRLRMIKGKMPFRPV
jgi:hypothetical protein